jgi:hypothetical protein
MSMYRVSSIAALTILLVGSVTTAREQAADASQAERPVADTQPVQLIIGGTVRRVLGSGAFVIEDRHAAESERLVLVPDADATPVTGATVIARGLLRTFEPRELDTIRSWTDLDERTHEEFAGRPILLATSLSTASGRSLMRDAPPTLRPFASRSPTVSSRHLAALTLHPAALAELIDVVGGRLVTLPGARVVAVINPRVLLIESASSLPATVGNLDRVLVLIGGGELRVDPRSLTGADVRVVGTARTLLGARITGEVAWPSELTPEMVKRLEIRAAVLATSIHTADGVELTGRPQPPDR